MNVAEFYAPDWRGRVVILENRDDDGRRLDEDGDARLLPFECGLDASLCVATDLA